MARRESLDENAAAGTLRVQVAEVEPLARAYARLGLRIVRSTRARALVALPCGVLLILSRRAPAA